ncbi:MAG: methyltransferase domain-containing protein [Microcoleaceae cyanobacterium]
MSERKVHWENVYQTKSPMQVSWYQQQPTLSLELINHTNISKDQPIIDVGGGASVLVDYLYQQGFTNLAVLDIAGEAIALSQKRLGKIAENIQWYESDVTKFQPDRQFSLWHDRAVFHFLTDPKDRQNYRQLLAQALIPNGHLIIATFAIGGPAKCSGLDIIQYDAEKLRIELGDHFQLIEAKSEIHLTPTDKEQEFIYCHFQKMPIQ